MLYEKSNRCGMVGKWHLGKSDEVTPESRGFDFFYGHRNGSHDYFRSSTDPEVRNYDLHPIYRNAEIQPPLQERGGYLTDIFTGEAVDVIEKNSDKPFCLYLAYNAVHYPWQVPDSRLMVRCGRFSVSSFAISFASH